MTNNRREQVLKKSGSVLQIPCGDGLYSYGMITSQADLLCWDHQDKGEGGEFDNLPVLFVLWVHLQDLLSKRWPIVAKIDPQKYSQWNDLDYVIQDPINKKLYLTKDGTNPRPATYEQCVGLERAAVWDARHVEDRLRAHYEGVPCKWIQPYVRV